MKWQWVLYAYLIIINLCGFILMGIDKRKAVKHRWRIKERTLFLIAALGGSAGSLFGMKHFRHKTKHKLFAIGLPLLLLLHILLFICILYLKLR